MVTEYEQLLSDMVKERKAKVEELRGRKGKQKEVDSLLSEIGFIEVELQRYDRGLRLFRSKNLPKVGRWGKAGAGPAGEEGTQS